ncbi:conserved hypothetical protein [Treponema primitia ZAS-2]|uniref:Lanthionine synthetase C family protein n=1 Tax=Treponema primitia (strain ATCC BAA-887 / DSM 12427 / ZAS-2) TaxID=545694 RepID=F5YK75_TREPZ|nr:lanthionine synthetase LanC family protein [Treponema primitia]AEF84476.1 conserved hypothetical protein [Treponema primitia ZAS-2]
MDINLYPVHTEAAARDYLLGARTTAEYIRSSAVSDEKGVFWQDEKGQEPQIDFYNGSAGIIIFFLQLAKATGDGSYLQDALGGGNYILNELKRTNYEYPIKSKFASFHTYVENAPTFYTGGFAGVAFSLIELSKASGNRLYEQAALALTEKIAASAKPVESGVIWTGFSGANHDAGTIVYLLYASNHFKRLEWRTLAAEGGRAIISTGISHGVDQVEYKGFKNPLLRPDAPETIYPNFAYGTAGMSYALAKLYEETGDRDFLEAAEKGASYLISIASPVKDGKLIAHHLPHHEDEIFYLSTCHGPAGTARLFVLLNRLTKNQKYQNFYEELIRGIIATGAPEYHSAGYWNCHSQCCGTAGILNLFIGIWIESGKKAYLDYATRAGKVLLGSAKFDGEKAVWYQAFSRTNPGKVDAVLGYSEGAAGIGAALLQLATALDGSFNTIRLPDDPFAAK